MSNEPSLAVLVVEDNPVNQKVVGSLLTKWGHRVVLACDGARGLEALERKHFDLVLMDIQMPVMDGIEATRSIRAREREQGGHIPIIAITAHARTQDQERCIDAGMDGYLTKPINSAMLRNAIAELLPIAAADGNGAASETTNEQVDFDQLKEFVGDDPDLIAEVVQIFLHDAPVTFSLAERAIAHADPKALESSAHRLKGSLSTMGAAAASEVAYRLESMGREGTLAGAAEVCEELRHEIDATSECLRAWMDKKAA